jgi:hypothetical protein
MLTTKPMKAMLTGPVTILNWSFVRDDIPRSTACRQTPDDLIISSLVGGMWREGERTILAFVGSDAQKVEVREIPEQILAIHLGPECNGVNPWRRHPAASHSTAEISAGHRTLRLASRPTRFDLQEVGNG